MFLRYEKQLQAEEEAYQQTRRRLYQEIQDEKERLAEQAIKQKQDMDRLRTQLEETHSSSSNLLRREYEKTREENNRRHEVSCSYLILIHPSLTRLSRLTSDTQLLWARLCWRESCPYPYTLYPL